MCPNAAWTVVCAPSSSPLRADQKEAKYLPELKLIAPLLSNMEVVQCISVRGGTSVYIVRSTKTNTTYILKHISVPESQKQVDALLFTGAAATTEDAQKYYEQVVSDYQSELEQLEALSASSNIESYRSYQIVPKEDAVGYDVYLLAENRKTLQDYLQETPITHLCAVNLGLDLCAALGDLRAAGFIHRDVKPSNVYLNQQGHFVLGDLGIARIDELKYCSMPEHMLSPYSAPELFDLVGSIEPTTDIYSAGLILYRIFNGNHAPFEDEKTSAKAADRRRITGEELPAPLYADYELTEILRKACAFKPEDRYQTPDELRQALVEYAKRNQVEDTPIVPPIVVDEEPVTITPEDEEIEPVQFADAEALPEDFKQSFSPDTDMLSSIIDAVHREMENEPDDEPEEETSEDPACPNAPSGKKTVRKRRKGRSLTWVLLAILAAIAAVCVYFFVIAPATLHVSDIQVLGTDVTSVTVQVDSREKSGAFEITCSDAYGNSFRAPYVKGEQTVFTGLAAGTQYTITVDPGDKKLTGNYVTRVSTMAETEILSFTVTPVALTQVEVNLTLNGPDPGTWTVAYAADGVDTTNATFNGHSTVIANLESGKEYTFTLLPPENTHLTGVTEASYSTVPTVDIDKTTVALSSSSAILSWTFIGEAPEHWTVRVEGADGSKSEQEVQTPNVTLENLTSGMEYTVTISAPTMLLDGTLTITPTVTNVTDLKVEATEAGDYKVSWRSTGGSDEIGWTVLCTPKGANASAALLIDAKDAETCTIPLKSLVPNTTYTVSLELANGDILDGSTDTEFTTPEEENYHDHGLTSGYIGLYKEPEQADWTVKDLSSPASTFTTDETIAFAIQGVGTLQDSTDEITITIVVRDADDQILDVATDSAVWNDMWTKDLCVGAFPRAVAKAGSYTLQVYFDGQSVVKEAFTVTESN